MTFIYGLWDPRNGTLRYVGKSNNPDKRVREHISKASKAGNSRKAVWIRELLQDNLAPLVDILEEVPDNQWELAERAWIIEFESYGLELLNMMPGGNGSHGRILSDEHKRNISLALMGVKRQPLSEEQKKKLSEVHSGKKKGPMPQSTKDKLSLALTGKKLTEEHKHNISIGSRGHEVGEETRKKLRLASLGHKHTEETKLKLSKIQSGKVRKPLSEETKRKISDAHRRKATSTG